MVVPIRNQLVILGASAVAVSCPVDVTEDILATINIPAGMMGLTGILRCTTFWTMTNSVNNKTLRVRLGGIGGTQYLNMIETTRLTAEVLTMIANRGAANSQFGVIPAVTSAFGDSVSGFLTSALDTSVAQTLVITGQKALNSETLTLESYFVELLLP
jgi:hypothetical protein